MSLMELGLESAERPLARIFLPLTDIGMDLWGWAGGPASSPDFFGDLGLVKIPGAAISNSPSRRNSLQSELKEVDGPLRLITRPASPYLS